MLCLQQSYVCTLVWLSAFPYPPAAAAAATLRARTTNWNRRATVTSQTETHKHTDTGDSYVRNRQYDISICFHRQRSQWKVRSVPRFSVKSVKLTNDVMTFVTSLARNASWFSSDMKNFVSWVLVRLDRPGRYYRIQSARVLGMSFEPCCRLAIDFLHPKAPFNKLFK